MKGGHGCRDVIDVVHIEMMDVAVVQVVQVVLMRHGGVAAPRIMGVFMCPMGLMADGGDRAHGAHGRTSPGACRGTLRRGGDQYARRMDEVRVPGRLLVGTSGFAYPDWAPRFYPAGLRAAGLLSHYATRLPAVELNNTFYQQPTPPKIASWLAATPEDFRFVVKAQRGGSWRAIRQPDPAETVDWLTTPHRLFGDRLGCVLFRVDASIKRDDDALGRLVGAWPRDIPVAFELQDASWEMDEVHAILREGGAALVATDVDGAQEPPLRRVGAFLYLRLRRTTMTDTDVEAWARRLAPFLEDGMDAYVFFRHDEDGASALRAEALRAALPGVGPER
jgi:uncharacterized protein YecE (DUF72 family)